MPLNRDEIDTDIRYMEDADQDEAYCMDSSFGCWPDVSSLFERKLAANIQKRSALRLELYCFIRVVGKAAQCHDSIITLDVEMNSDWVEAQVSDVARRDSAVPPITADGVELLDFAMRWFATRALPFRLSVHPDHYFWIPIDWCSDTPKAG